MTREMPDLHKKALKYKNFMRLKHDGGRAWIKDPQLHDAVHGVNRWMETRHEDGGKENKEASEK